MMMLGGLRSGFHLLLRGMGLVLCRRRLAMLGMLPPVLVSAVMITLIALLGFFGLGPLTDMATGWVPESVRTAVRILLGGVILALAVVVAVVLFVSITLAVGSPIYEKISIAVEQQVGRESLRLAEPAARGVLRSARQSTTVVLLSAIAAGVLFLFGLVPVVGSVVSLLVGALVGGYFLVLEMTSGPFDRWGRVGLGEKVALLNANKAKVVGFGLPVFLLFSIPILSVLLFPAATAGATLLAHDLDQERAVKARAH